MDEAIAALYCSKSIYLGNKTLKAFPKNVFQSDAFLSQMSKSLNRERVCMRAPFSCFCNWAMHYRCYFPDCKREKIKFWFFFFFFRLLLSVFCLFLCSSATYTQHLTNAYKHICMHSSRFSFVWLLFPGVLVP